MWGVWVLVEGRMSRVPKNKNKCAFLIKKNRKLNIKREKSRKPQNCLEQTQECLTKFKLRLEARGTRLPNNNYASRPPALKQKKKGHERILPFVTTYHPAVQNLKQIVMEKWSLTQNQPFMKTIYKSPPIIS